MGGKAREVVIIGGLDPDFLVDTPPTPHLGTTDIDILLEVGFAYDRDALDFSWLQRSLIDAGFTPTSARQPWRWQTAVEGVQITVDLLCDTPDHQGLQIALPGCDLVVAQNVLGPAPALNDTQDVTLLVPEGLLREMPNEPRTVVVRFAGLGGYLLSKAAAVARRGADKDYYDLVFVILYNSRGGPTAAARSTLEALPSPPLDDHLGVLTRALDEFSSERERGPGIFAEQMQASGSTVDIEILIQDAISAVAEYRHALGETTS